jgi:metallo-beta-lactamase family protein
MSIAISFLGAAGTVTGSRHLVDAGRSRVMVDCGQFQGLKELRLRNWRHEPIDTRSIDAVLLTHAHIDHSGLLPRLVKDGYRGPIYTTPATAELAEILLKDAARLQEEDARYANRKGYSKHHPALPLFTEEDAEAALRHFRTVPFHQALHIGDVTARFANAGHILGSAHLQLDLRDGASAATVVFSGDIGRYGVPLHSDPAPLPACDALVMESTYGDRDQDPAPLTDRLRDAILPTIERRGIVLIPSFAVARAQLLTLVLGELIASGAIPPVPIDIDSPMAVDVTRLYTRYAGDEGLDEELKRRGPGSLAPATLRLHRSVDESKALNALPGPRIIISSSGMLTGGRVLHHLQRLAGDSANLILLAGYQAEGTRGRDLANGRRTVRMHGHDVAVHAQVKQLDGFSAHADRAELIRWAGSGPKPPRTIFLVHGEPQSSLGLAAGLAGKAESVLIPRFDERFEFVPGSGAWRSAGGG